MGDSAQLRDRVLQEGAIPRLYDLIPGDSKVKRINLSVPSDHEKEMPGIRTRSCNPLLLLVVISVDLFSADLLLVISNF